jgi:IS5 family transposase
MTFDCMSEAELELWKQAAVTVSKQTGYLVKEPCTDCPASFRLDEIAAGRCDRVPLSEKSSDARAYNREWMRRARARAREYNQAVEYSDSIAHNAQRPPVRLYSERGGVDVPEYRRNAS